MSMLPSFPPGAGQQQTPPGYWGCIRLIDAVPRSAYQPPTKGCCSRPHLVRVASSRAEAIRRSVRDPRSDCQGGGVSMRVMEGRGAEACQRLLTIPRAVSALVAGRRVLVTTSNWPADAYMVPLPTDGGTRAT